MVGSGEMSIFAARGCSGLEVSAPLASLTSILHNWPMECCIYLSSFRNIWPFPFGWIFPKGQNIWGIYVTITPKNSSINYPKLRRSSHQARKSIEQSGLWLSRRILKLKNVQKQCISPMCWAAPSGRVSTKLGELGDIADVINHAEFQVNHRKSSNFTGERNLHVPIG